MQFRILSKDRVFVDKELDFVRENTRFLMQDKFMQHGTTSVMSHCISVAYMSCVLSRKLHAKIRRKDLVRGALLHDYFLYDWHVTDNSHRLHGFFHAKKSLVNAMMDVELSPREQNIILRHMFPLNPIPPKYYEAWIVCMADKFCSTLETLHISVEFV